MRNDTYGYMTDVVNQWRVTDRAEVDTVWNNETNLACCFDVWSSSKVHVLFIINKLYLYLLNYCITRVTYWRAYIYARTLVWQLLLGHFCHQSEALTSRCDRQLQWICPSSHTPCHKWGNAPLSVCRGCRSYPDTPTVGRAHTASSSPAFPSWPTSGRDTPRNSMHLQVGSLCYYQHVYDTFDKSCC